MNVCSIPWQAVKIWATSTFSWKRPGLAPSPAVLTHTWPARCQVGMLAQTPHSLMGTLLWRAHLGALGSFAPVWRGVIYLNLTIWLTGCAICKFYCSQQRAAIEPPPQPALTMEATRNRGCWKCLCSAPLCWTEQPELHGLQPHPWQITG